MDLSGHCRHRVRPVALNFFASEMSWHLSTFPRLSGTGVAPEHYVATFSIGRCKEPKSHQGARDGIFRKLGRSGARILGGEHDIAEPFIIQFFLQSKFPAEQRGVDIVLTSGTEGAVIAVAICLD